MHGTLHLNADGSYTYQSTANNITADTTDVFVYTIKDGDGDLSTTTLTIDLTNGRFLRRPTPTSRSTRMRSTRRSRRQTLQPGR